MRRETSALPEGQLRQPIRVELMRQVVIGNGALGVGIERVLQATADQSNVLISHQSEAHTRGRRREVDGFRVGVVEIELQSVSKLLAHTCLQRVEIGVSDRTPAI